MTIALLANGLIDDYAYTYKKIIAYDYLIVCDGGLGHAAEMDITPDVIIGDMDSVNRDVLERFTSRGVRTIRFPSKKDDTDLALAVEYALTLDDVVSLTVFGAFGGRFDHQLANVHALVPATEKGIRAEMLDEKTSVRLIGRHDILNKENYAYISLIPLTSEVVSITATGLEYPLNGETLRFGTTLGVSNRFVSEAAEIITEEGLLLAVRVRE